MSSMHLCVYIKSRCENIVINSLTLHLPQTADHLADQDKADKTS